MMGETGEVVFELETEIANIAKACGLPEAKVRSAAALLAEGNTIPFIARYRKERTGGLDETALRAIEDTIAALRELAERKNTILKAIREQGKLTDALRETILTCPDKKELEELYLPYKLKRRTRATIARQRGLEPLAEFLTRQVNPGMGRQEVLRPYICPDQDVPDGEAALSGACDIVAEGWADDLQVRSQVREAMRHGMLCSRVRKEWVGKPSKFEAYYDRREPWAKVPSHRYLAVRRGEAEEVLRVGIEIDDEAVIRRLTGRLVTNPSFLFRRELAETVADCCRRLLFPSVEAALLAEMKETADDEAIRVFSQNLRELLLAVPAGPQVVMGIDPGFRTGCKVAVVDATGKFLEHTTIYPTAPHNRTEEAANILLNFDRPLRGDADCHRDGHGVAGNRFLRRLRAAARRPPRGADERERIGGFDLLGQRRGPGGVPRLGPDCARGDQHRPAIAGPAGRVGQDRPQIDRRRPISA